MSFEPEQLRWSGRELADTLRSLRKRAGLSGDQLAARCNMSQSKVSRIETGRLRPTLLDIERILRALDVPPDVATDVLALARIANTEWRSHRDLHRKGLLTGQTDLKALEATSREMRYFLLSMITGLLSTPEYIRASLDHNTGDTSRTVAAKLERQAVLHDSGKSFRFLLTEQAVRWPVVGPAALAEQIDRLVALSHAPSVRLGVIPLGTPTPVRPLNTFTVYDGSLATIETDTGVLVLRDHQDIQAHRDTFAELERCALFDNRARAKLAEWAATV